MSKKIYIHGSIQISNKNHAHITYILISIHASFSVMPILESEQVASRPKLLFCRHSIILI